MCVCTSVQPSGRAGIRSVTLGMTSRHVPSVILVQNNGFPAETNPGRQAEPLSGSNYSAVPLCVCTSVQPSGNAGIWSVTLGMKSRHVPSVILVPNNGFPAETNPGRQAEPLSEPSVEALEEGAAARLEETPATSSAEAEAEAETVAPSIVVDRESKRRDGRQKRERKRIMGQINRYR
jgi:hypothetical protein